VSRGGVPGKGGGSHCCRVACPHAFARSGGALFFGHPCPLTSSTSGLAPVMSYAFFSPTVIGAEGYMTLFYRAQAWEFFDMFVPIMVALICIEAIYSYMNERNLYEFNDTIVRYAAPLFSARCSFKRKRGPTLFDPSPANFPRFDPHAMAIIAPFYPPISIANPVFYCFLSGNLWFDPQHEPWYPR